MPAIPGAVRELLAAPNYVHLSTLRRDGTPRSYMDPIAIKYTGEPFPSRGPDRRCFVIEVERAWQTTLGFVHAREAPPTLA